MTDKQLIDALELCFDKSPEAAVEYLKSQGIEVTWDWQEQLAKIEQHIFTVSKVANAEILQEFKNQLEKAIEGGQTFKQFKDDIAPTIAGQYSTRADGSAWRLDTIFRTNMQSSYNAGRFLEQTEVVDEFPFWQYIAVMDNRTRPRHAELNGKVLKANDSFWTTSYPPNGYLCRCRVMTLSDDDVKRLGLKITKGTALKKNKPDPGFDTNPAAVWKPDMTKFSPEIRNQLSKSLKAK